MDARKVVGMLSDRDVFDLMDELDAQPISKGNTFECRTVCHDGHKHKLIYYKDSKSFYCYTNCGHLSIFDMLGKALDLEFIDALKYIVRKYNLHDSDHIEGFTYEKVVNPGALLKQKLEKVKAPAFEKLDEHLLLDFYPYYHKSWIDEGISISSMMKYNIRYSIVDNQIIIPHYDEYGNLIGVRGRNLNKDKVDEGKKYMPIFYEGKVLKHLTGANLYGLDKNKEMIEKHKTMILFESEKSVLQLDSMMPDHSIGVCVSGSSLTQYQLELIKKLRIDEVIIGVDKEFENIGDDKEKRYAEKIIKVFRNRLAPYVRVSVLWDLKNELNEKDSPTDRGVKIFKDLYENRIYI